MNLSQIWWRFFKFDFFISNFCEKNSNFDDLFCKINELFSNLMNFFKFDELFQIWWTFFRYDDIFPKLDEIFANQWFFSNSMNFFCQIDEHFLSLCFFFSKICEVYWIDFLKVSGRPVNWSTAPGQHDRATMESSRVLTFFMGRPAPRSSTGA